MTVGEHQEEPENEMRSKELCAAEWTKFNLDTGAAQTAITNTWDGIAGSGVTFKTASGELVPSEGTGVYFGADELHTLQGIGANCRSAQAVGVGVSVLEEGPTSHT